MALHAKDPNATTISDSEYTRLHVTPLNPDLLPAILPPSILPNARNISYHSIETFPEKAYGFIELPAMDAEKVKKRLNGAILKGSKVRIEKARPHKEAVADEEERPNKSKKPTKASRKRKRADDTIIGVEIEDRSVKRGWTTPPAPGKLKENDKDKRKIKSKYTSNSECLFKAVIPPNVATKSKAMDKPEKAERKKAKAGKDAIIHEFSKTTKYATFLRSTTSSNKKLSVEFIEGKGWVDEDGNVIEEVVTKARKSSKSSKSDKGTPKPEPLAAVEKEEIDSSGAEISDDDGSSDEAWPTAIAKATSNGNAPPAIEREEETSKEKSSSEGSSSEDGSEELDIAQSSSKAALLASLPNDTETSSSGSSSSESESNSESSEDEDTTSVREELPSPRSVSRPQSSSGVPINLSIKIPEPEITSKPVSATVHPLEALYKRPKPGQDTAPKPDVPSFSFFGADGDVDEGEEMEEAQDKVPLTPFTQRDFEYRGLRSAAPTPDTAHANKRFMWPSSRDDDEDEDDATPSSPTRHQKFKDHDDNSKPKGKGKEKKQEDEKEESDFQKWFYEHRGDTNRAWKKRRKIAGKEKRHRDNKKRGERAA